MMTAVGHWGVLAKGGVLSLFSLFAVFIPSWRQPKLWLCSCAMGHSARETGRMVSIRFVREMHPF